MKKGKITILVSVAMFVSICVLSCTEDTDPVGILQSKSPLINDVTTNTLKVQKDINTRVETLNFDNSVKKRDSNGNEYFSNDRAIAYRISQICSQVWDNGIFYSYQIQKIVTGWNTDESIELFIEVLGIPPERVTIAADATLSKDLSLGDSWYEIDFANGRAILFKGTNKIYHEPYLQLRDRFLNGDEEITAEMVEQERRKVQQTLETLPFTEKFIIQEY